MRKKRMIAVMLLSAALLGGCGKDNDIPAGNEAKSEAAEQAGEEKEEPETEQAEVSEAGQPEAELPDGIYTAKFTTDSSMFHVNEACDGRGELAVEDGKMTIHIFLGSKNIINLYPGLAEDAEKEGAELLLSTEDTVTYSDGMTEEVYGFDVPVPVLGEDFDLALIGTKGKWYDHKVSVSDPVPLEEKEKAEGTAALEEGTWRILSE